MSDSPLVALIQAHRAGSLGPCLRGLARASVAAGAIAALAGCAADHWDGSICTRGEWRAVTGLTLNVDPDYLDAVEDSIVAVGVLDATGVPCETATDVETCNSTLQGTRPGGRVLRTTTGDTVESHQTDAEVLAVLGTMDSPEEVELRLWLQRYDTRCVERPGYVRWVDDHYEARGIRMDRSCSPILVNLYELRVDVDGTVTQLSSEEIQRTVGVCI